MSSSAPAHGKHFTLYSHPGGPNPWKVAIILEELGLSYEMKFVSIPYEVKEKAFTDINPNGRVPALVDHQNNDFIIWESGAIILYVVARYDKEKKISFGADLSGEETASAVQWLMFQMSGQGPYYGQAVWFSRYCPGDKIPIAIERYVNEIRRVISVINKELEDHNKEWLVGGRVSYADLSFLPWNWILESHFMETEQLKGWVEEFPRAAEWHRKMNERPVVKKIRAEKQEAMDKDAKAREAKEKA